MAPSLGDEVTPGHGKALPNRLMKSALSEALADRSNRPDARLRRLYARWADGGFGLVVTGNVMVDRRQLGEPGNVVAESEDDVDALRAWAATFAGSATPLWMQVNHPGRQANALIGRQRPVAPSAVAARVPGATRPRALEAREIEEIVRRYARAAVLAESAGFDGVQIHGAHGYLVTQFLSPQANTRDDAWGGDAARRRRFVLEVLRAIRREVSSEFSVAIKLNSADFQRGGFTEEESREVVRALVSEGIDLIEISGGTYESPAMMGTVRASTAAREAYFLEYAASVRDIAEDVPLAVTGGFRTRAGMAEAVASGDCDVVGVGRAACVLPDAAQAVLADERDLPVGSVRFGARGVLSRVADMQALDGALDLQWHTDQLHLLGAGREPDPARPWWRTVASITRRNGFDAVRPRRSL